MDPPGRADNRLVVPAPSVPKAREAVVVELVGRTRADLAEGPAPGRGNVACDVRFADGGRDDFGGGACDVGRKLAGRAEVAVDTPAVRLVAVLGAVLLDGAVRLVVDPVLAWLGRGTADRAGAVVEADLTGEALLS